MHVLFPMHNLWNPQHYLEKAPTLNRSDGLALKRSLCYHFLCGIGILCNGSMPLLSETKNQPSEKLFSDSHLWRRICNAGHDCHLSCVKESWNTALYIVPYVICIYAGRMCISISFVFFVPSRKMLHNDLRLEEENKAQTTQICL